MDRSFYKQCIRSEVYRGGVSGAGPAKWFRQFYLKHIEPSRRAVFLIRKTQYLHGRHDRFSRLRVLLIKSRLARSGILVSEDAEIGLGLRLPHPTSVVIGSCVVAGENLTMYQNTTLGGSRTGDVKKGNQPVVGKDVTLFANSLALGKITIGDQVTVGANSLLLSDADAGVWAGSPARRVK
jgi:serine O-acetyltransferase